MVAEPDGGPERRQLLTLDVMQRTGIDEAMIRRLVHAFYGAIRADAMPGVRARPFSILPIQPAQCIPGTANRPHAAAPSTASPAPAHNHLRIVGLP